VFLELHKTYRYASKSTPRVDVPEIDNIPNYYHITVADDGKLALLERGINPVAKTGNRRPAVLLRSSPASDKTAWQDNYDFINKSVLYFGDNKGQYPKAGEAPGSKVLLDLLEEHRSPKTSVRSKTCPLVFFETPESGFVIFRGIGVLRSAETVLQKHPKLGYEFENFAFDCQLLDLASEKNQLNWDWILLRKDKSVHDALCLEIAPDSWRSWVGNPKSEIRNATDKDAVDSLEGLGLSTYTKSTLLKAKIKTVEKLLQNTEDDLLKIEKLGDRSLKEIIKKLSLWGLKLSGSVSEVMISEKETRHQERNEQVTLLDLGLSERPKNCLQSAGIRTLEQLLEYSEDDLLKVKNLGGMSLAEIIKKLSLNGLALRSSSYLKIDPDFLKFLDKNMNYNKVGRNDLLNTFANANIYNLEDLVSYSEKALTGFWGLGPRRAKKLKTALAAKGMELAETIDSKLPQSHPRTFPEQTKSGVTIEELSKISHYPVNTIRRYLRIHYLAEKGLSLTEIGNDAEVNLTRERVRQIIYLFWSIEYKNWREEARSRKSTKQSKKKYQKVCEDIITLGHSPDDVLEDLVTTRGFQETADNYKLDFELVKELYTHSGKTFIIYLPGKDRDKLSTLNYTDDQLIEYIQIAYENTEGDYLTQGQFNRFAATQTITPEAWPTWQTPSIRFGSWKEACEEAGLPTVDRPRRNDYIPDSQLSLAIEKFCRECLAQKNFPSFAEYRRWYKSNSAPSPGLLRHRLDFAIQVRDISIKLEAESDER
jgi:DNA-directed RNA polymerase alpha subunit